MIFIVSIADGTTFQTASAYCPLGPFVLLANSCDALPCYTLGRSSLDASAACVFPTAGSTSQPAAAVGEIRSAHREVPSRSSRACERAGIRGVPPLSTCAQAASRRPAVVTLPAGVFGAVARMLEQPWNTDPSLPKQNEVEPS